MDINERYEMIGKKIDKEIDGKLENTDNYEEVVKEIDEYFEEHDM